MKELNLTSLEKSDIKYKISQFPDGQQDVTLLDPEALEDEETQISSRFNSFRDLELIACAAYALKRAGAAWIGLFIPYVLGARSDIQFQRGGTSYLVDIIAPFLNSLPVSRITALDVHSPIAAACIHNFHDVSSTNFVESILWTLYPKGSDNFYIVSPDAGAFKKLHKLADKIEYNREIIICSKARSVEGKLTDTRVPLDLKHSASDLLIIDDICDGGATFLNIAKEIKRAGTHKGKLYLIVTHGIFSKGFSELTQYFDGIFCTNSVKDLGTDDVNKIHQLNVI